MNWFEAALILAVLVGVTAGTILVLRSPTFWATIGAAAVKAAFPAIVAYVTRRLPPEHEAAWRDCIRRGGVWDPVRRRCKD